MNPLESFYSTFGTTGLIALILSLVFASAALINTLRRKAHARSALPKQGPIHMSDPHSGTLVSGVDSLPPPVAEAEKEPEDQEPEKEQKQETGTRFFRQLDPRGVEVDDAQSEKNHDYLWE